MAGKSKCRRFAAPNRFVRCSRLSSRRAGAKSDVIEETALEVRTALMDSLAAAKADRWEEAESSRLDAYTAFDSDIEPRVLPRDPKLAMLTERSFATLIQITGPGRPKFRGLRNPLS